MQGFNLWKGKKTKDYHFHDRIAKDYIRRSGTACFVHKYIGPYEQDKKDASLMIPTEDINELTIQDVLFGETRDRKYAEDVIELRGTYNISDSDFDMSQFGYMLQADTIVIELHSNDMIELIGRKLMTGDVIELPHLRDDTSLDSTVGEIKKYYVVQDSNRSASGYGPTWYSHLWRVRCTPIVDTQEFRSILHNENIGIKNDTIDWLTDYIMSGNSDAGVETDMGGKQQTLDYELQKVDTIREYQRNEVMKRSFDYKHLYIKCGSEMEKQGLITLLVNGDAIPNSFEGEYIFSGTSFPEEPSEGDFFVRVDYDPPRLFKRVGTAWRKVSDMWRKDWTPAHTVLESFINNSNKTVIGNREDQSFDERQPLSEVVLPKTKKGPQIVPTPKRK